MEAERHTSITFVDEDPAQVRLRLQAPCDGLQFERKQLDW